MTLNRDLQLYGMTPHTHAPLDLPAGTTIKASAWYDNSAANKSNPDATKDVWWGDQTWEEMMFTSFTWYVKPLRTP